MCVALLLHDQYTTGQNDHGLGQAFSYGYQSQSGWYQMQGPLLLEVS